MSTAHLRPLQRNDLDNIMPWVNDPDIVGNFQHFNRTMSREEEKQYLEKLLSSPTDKVFAVEAEDGTYLGNIGLHQIYLPSRNARFAIILGRKDYWGQGYAQSAIPQLLKVAFDDVGLHKVWGIHFQENKKAAHLYEKLGFRTEGLLREEYFQRGEYHTMVRIAMLEGEYQKRYGIGREEKIELGKESERGSKVNSAGAQL